MDIAEWLTRGTVWLALSLYVAGELAAAFASGLVGIKVARWLNALGLAAFLAHVGCAFHFHHRWSHAAASADTARQTAEFSGWYWGGGLYLNYLFGLVWLGEFIWAAVSQTTHAQRRRYIGWLVRTYFMFMIFNGAVVFAKCPMRWYGLLLLGLLVLGWWRLGKQGNGSRKLSPPSAHE